MIGEVGKKVIETTSEMSKKIGETKKEVSKEIGNSIENIAAETTDLLKDIDIDKKIGQNIDKSANTNENYNKIEGIDIDKKISKNSDVEKTNNSIGGKYKDLQNSSKYDSSNQEIHHIPADSTSELSRSDGPSIIMDKEDHRRTASCGNSNEAKAYRMKQKEYIGKGQFDKAVKMDIEDIKSKFGNKYDKQIDEMKEYLNKLRKDGKI